MRGLTGLVLAGACWLAASCSLASAADGSGALWGARDPGTCAARREAAPPSPDEVVALLRCWRETADNSSAELWLMENVAVTVGAAQPFVELYNVVAMPAADTTKPVHAIEGGWTWVVCIPRADAANPERNCRETDVTNAAGACWTTQAGEWRCFMNGRSGQTRKDTAPPR